MPIKDPTKYPADWLEIRARILDRAGNRCEGSPAYPDCRAENGKPHPATGSRVVLTIAHRDCALVDHSDANLAAWCQRCHLTHDARHRAKLRVAPIGVFPIVRRPAGPPPGFREGPPRTFQPMLADSPPQTDLTMIHYHEVKDGEP